MDLQIGHLQYVNGTSAAQRSPIMAVTQLPSCPRDDSRPFLTDDNDERSSSPFPKQVYHSRVCPKS